MPPFNYMNREIKFRAWDKKRETMWSWAELLFQPIRLANWLIEYGHSKVDENFDKYGDGKILMQYTGLKDKRGAEIYEGDIVRARNKNETNTYKVSWENGSFTLENYGLLSEYWYYSEEIEIIGNIYENKDLIK